VRHHQCQVEGDGFFPSPSDHTVSDTSQDAVGLLGHLDTMPAHMQPSFNQQPHVVFCWAAFQPLFLKPAWGNPLHGVIVIRVLKQINTPTQLGVVCKLTDGALIPLIQIIDKDIKQN